MVWLSLLKEDPRNIKQLMHNRNGMEDLRKDDGLEKLIGTLKNVVQQKEEIEAVTKRKTSWRRMIGDSKEVTKDDSDKLLVAELVKGRISEVKKLIRLRNLSTRKMV